MKTIQNRIKYLENNPELGKRRIANTINSGSVYSNCHGTAIWILGLEKIIKKLSRKNIFPDSYVKSKIKGPPLVKRNLMYSFFEKDYSKIICLPNLYNLVAFWEENKMTEIVSLQHTGIITNTQTKELFNQLDTGKRFAFIAEDQYKLSLEKDLVSCKEIFITYHKLKV